VNENVKLCNFYETPSQYYEGNLAERVAITKTPLCQFLSAIKSYSELNFADIYIADMCNSVFTITKRSVVLTYNRQSVRTQNVINQPTVLCFTTAISLDISDIAV
jgi:hypothetical protein